LTKELIGMSAETVTLQDIYRARRTIAPHVRRTPLVPSAALSERTGASVFLKLENLQETGAFKLRGATNRLAVLTGEERARGVVTMSTGNHGRAVAFAATRLNVRATVCMSSLVPANKVAAIRDSGAEVRIIGRSQDEAGREAERLVREEGMILVPPFDDPFIIAGQGTIGLELLEDQPDLDTVLVPLSGGGLIAGIAVALKAAAPGVRIVGISMKRGPAMHDSLKAGRPIAVEEGASLADSLGGGIGLDNRYTFRLVRDLVDDAILVDEDAIGRAMAHAYWQERQIIEGAAAVGIAALLTGRVEAPAGGTVACILSGANVAMDSFTDIVARHRPGEETR
jgi:threonine dehydratase